MAGWTEKKPHALVAVFMPEAIRSLKMSENGFPLKKKAKFGATGDSKPLIGRIQLFDRLGN
jgi:hypothetical protein